jgi:hypothetical protein
VDTLRKGSLAHSCRHLEALRGRKLTAQEKLVRHLKWKPLFEAYSAEQRRRNLRLDAIIRDPEITDTDRNKGISSWFRVDLIDTYDKGFMAGLQWNALVMDAETDELRFPHGDRSEEGNVKVMMTGFIPYENIEDVDWSGYSYYAYPHIYCYFNHKRKLYERIAFCEQRQLNEHVYFSELVDYKSVLKRRKISWLKRLTGLT